MSDDEKEDIEPTSEEQNEIIEFINVDTFLDDHVGSHGLWQWIVALFLMFTTPSPATLPVYANSYGRFRCRMEPQVEKYIADHKLSFSEVVTRIGPWSHLTDSSNHSLPPNAYGCYRYKLDWSTANLGTIFNTTVSLNPPSSTFESCPLGYVFNESNDFYPGNVVKEFEIVCEKSSLQSFGTSVYMFGMLIGFLIGGWCADRFGRRLTLTASSCIEVLATVVVSLAPHYAVYVLFRAVVGIGNTVKVAVGNVLVYEITVARYRSMFGAVLALGLDFIFRAFMALFAYLIPDWRALNAAVMCTGALGLLYPFILPESPRWLISRKRLRKAVDEMYRGCQINQRRKVVKEETYFDQLRTRASQLEERIKPMRTKCKCSCSCKGCKNGLWLKLFKSPKLIRLTALGSFIVFGITMCFFGLLLYARILIGSIYMHGFLSSLTGIPATLASALIYRYVRSRRAPLTAVLSFAGVFLILSLCNSFVQTEPVDLVLTICSNIGLILITTSVCMIYVYIAEIYPSEIRSYGFGVVFAISRIGSIICPFVNDLDESLSHGSPMIVYSGILIMVVWSLGMMPDTYGENVADFVKQEEDQESANNTDVRWEVTDDKIESDEKRLQ